MFKAEKALATLQSRPIPGFPLPGVPLVLSPYPPTNPPTPLPPPSALPRLVKHLPVGFGDSNLYDIFRPFGALASVRIPTHFGPDTGLIEFWNEDDARQAEEAMHCADIEGQNIAIQVYQPRRTASGGMNEFNPSAPSFVPSGSVFAYPNPAATYSPPRPHYSPRSPVSPIPHGTPPFVHGPGQQVQLAPVSGPGSTSHSGLIDPCNLFCKNLDPEIDSNSLFSHFRQVCRSLNRWIPSLTFSPFLVWTNCQVCIIMPIPASKAKLNPLSARVMRNEAGESRGFGFVSYQTPDQGMNMDLFCT